MTTNYYAEAMAEVRALDIGEEIQPYAIDGGSATVVREGTDRYRLYVELLNDLGLVYWSGEECYSIEEVEGALSALWPVAVTP